jgi:hypothetical protein
LQDLYRGSSSKELRVYVNAFRGRYLLAFRRSLVSLVNLAFNRVALAIRIFIWAVGGGRHLGDSSPMLK